MNNWFLLSLSAAFLWAVVNILDKIIVVEHIKFHWSRLILDSFVGLTVCIVLAALGVGLTTNIYVVTLSILAGVLLYGFNYLYYKGLESAEVPVVSALLQGVPVFSALWGFLFFQERYGWLVYLGIIFIISGAVFINAEENGKSKTIVLRGTNWRSATLYIIPGIFILSINYALQKYILNLSDSWTIFFWARIGAFIFTSTMLLFSPKIRTGFIRTAKGLKSKSYLLIGIIEWINLAGIYLLLKAYSTGTVTLVTTVAATQPVIVMILSVIATILFKTPSLANYDFRIILIRVFSITFMIIGVMLIS